MKRRLTQLLMTFKLRERMTSRRTNLDIYIDIFSNSAADYHVDFDEQLYVGPNALTITCTVLRKMAV